MSTGNRNFPGKQGRGRVFLASPEVVAASAVRGFLVAPDEIDADIPVKAFEEEPPGKVEAAPPAAAGEAPTEVEGRVWLVDRDNIDTDMIYHNRHLAVTDIDEMGRYCFGNLTGFEDFPERAQPGDIVAFGDNFGCGSSRQQAVDCFRALGVRVIIARSFGAIYERNAINAAMPVLVADVVGSDAKDGDEVEVDLENGTVELADGTVVAGTPFSEVQLDIYRRGGLLGSAG